MKNFSFLILVPSIRPFNAIAEGSTSSSLNVSWSAIPPIYHEGVLLGYNISYEFINITNFDHRNGTLRGYVFTTQPWQLWYDIQSLELFTNYTVQVAGYTNAGVGPVVTVYGQTLFFGMADVNTSIFLFSLFFVIM